MDIVAELMNEFLIKKFQVENTIELYDEGATVPFISRYRKEKTGSLSEIQVRDLLHRYDYFTELEERRKTILESIQAQGKLTPELEKKIRATKSKVELEDLYLPYKPKRITRGKKARDAGLEPLAKWLLACDSKTAKITEEASKYLTEKAQQAGFDTSEKIINGACDIIAEDLADNADIRKWLRELFTLKGILMVKVRKQFVEQKTKFAMYYDYQEMVKDIPSHRIFAILRGEREKVLAVELQYPESEAQQHLYNQLILHPASATENLLKNTADDSLNRLLATACETEVRKNLRQKAEEEAFKVFGENLRTVLLAPPAGPKPVLGIDPGFRTGCKVVALDTTGKLLEFQAIYPTAPRNDISGATKIIKKMISDYAIELIAIGNGTASRETEQFIRSIIEEYEADKRPTCLIVNESGASVYSASPLAVKEFPDHDVTVRGAVSIARRLQDPLSELVKIDPKSIGVGQYQHDVTQTKLKFSLEEVVESCVNMVGVDLNLASQALLKYVSGLNSTIADSIVAYRDQHGAFSSRKDLMKVSRLGVKTYEQAAGFLRIRNGKNPLDNSSVHPERYPVVVQMAESIKTAVDSLIGNTQLISKIDKNLFVNDDLGLPTLDDILGELEKPGRDPREKFVYAKFNDEVTEISDLTPGMKLEGTITNVTNFGAFVDIGVHQDGLVHISQLADHFVKDPTKVVKAGQIVKVTVLEVDADLKRISLSLKKDPANPGKKPADDKNTSKSLPQDLTKKGKSQWSKKPSQGKKKLVTVKPKFSLKQFMK